MIEFPISPGLLAMIQILGLPGLVFVIWYLDMMRFQKTEKSRDSERQAMEKSRDIERQTYVDQTRAVLSQYKEDVSDIRHMYANNARLCDDYDGTCKRLEKLFYETLNVISLNTQTVSKVCQQMDYVIRQMDTQPQPNRRDT